MSSPLPRRPETLFITASACFCVSRLKVQSLIEPFLTLQFLLLIYAEKHQRMDQVCPETARDMAGMWWLTPPSTMTWILGTGHLIFQLITW